MTDTDDDAPADEIATEGGKSTRKSRPWLNLIENYDKAGYRYYNDRATSIDKLYANLERLSSISRDREFQIFWANIGTLAPAMYSRPPVPVVVPRFRDRRPLLRTASELLERALSVNYEQVDINGIMLQVRDDLAVQARGVPWVRYDADKPGKDFYEKVCVDHVSRKDFKHDPARKWQEVDWVSRTSYLTKKQMRKRFQPTSGNAYRDAAYNIIRDDNNNTDYLEKAAVHEIWSQSAKKVIWVTEGVDVCLDYDDPPLKLDGFFPCPRPAYGTLQRDSLIPVPDYVFYKDQIEEINDLTARISSLSESLKVKGFYPSGAGELADAIEAAIKSVDNRAILVPVANWAAFGDIGGKDVIVWLPIEQIANVVTGLVALRRQLIEDVYQITGLSDIMRGSTDPNETLGAQELKSQYGSVRIRDRQGELARVARDVTRIVAEVMAEEFKPETLLSMAQMELPKDRDIAMQVRQLEQRAAAIQQQLAEVEADPQLMAQAQQRPEVAQQIVQQAQQQIQQIGQQIEKLKETVTIDQVMKLLREQRLRPFALDIETDSTIAPDENAQKERANEFMTAIGGLLQQMVPAIQAVPQIAPLMSETLKFAASQYRAGRTLDTAIDEFADQMTQLAGQPKGDPAADAAAKQAEAEQQRKQMDAAHARTMRERETQERIALMQAEDQRKAMEHQQAIDLGGLDIEKKRLEVALLGGKIDAQAQAAEIDAAQAVQQAEIAAEDASRRSEQEQAAFERDNAAAANAERRAEQETTRND